MANPSEILHLAFLTASEHLPSPLVHDAQIVDNVEYVCRNLQNRAGVRLLLACLLAKAHNPAVDIRKPYTEIGDPDSYSGRTYDERYVTDFINRHQLPCNNTTAFLTPALRNRNTVLTPDLNLVGRPPQLYRTTLELLTEVHRGKVSAADLLAEVVRWLLIIRNERQQRMETLLEGLKSSRNTASLSAEAIVTLIQQHLNSPKSSRLPVLVVAAAYQAAERQLGERVMPLRGHNVADRQSGSLGDLEVVLVGDDRVVTCYEMKTRRVTKNDLDHALQKIGTAPHRIDNYIFITTEAIAQEVKDYAASLYAETGGIEVVVLDCMGFLRHFLHLFHRLRVDFLNAYQDLLLAEPDSAVNQPLKEVFLALRQAAESGE
ncbi:MAG: restriction endonuclease, SacI family [Caldilineae bacterium]|nr:MAG: restriction endonuclease, SacI family [Caldilineae bacterium]